jgi:putative ABC transport system permease protein
MIAALRHALRTLRRSPAFALTVVATLGIGIGLNTAIFTVVDCVLLRPLGYHDANRIVALRTHFMEDKNVAGPGRSIPRLGGDDYSDLTRQVKAFESTAYYQGYSDGIGLNGEAVYLPVASVSPGFGQVMGVQPVAGRLFQPQAVDGHEALVSAAFAREHFGSAPAALGHSIQNEGALRTIVGVLPDGFSFPEKTSVWLENTLYPDTPNRTAYNQQAVAKRRADVSPAQLSAELAVFSHRLQTAFPEDAHKTIEAVSLQEQIVGKIRPTLNFLMGSVAVILLIVCANVTHLQLVRAARQLRAVTIRTALGASRTTLAARALLEASILALAGCLVAVLLAVPALQLLVRIAPPNIPRLADVHLNLEVLFFSVAISIALMGLTAILPVWRSWHIDPASALRQDASRGTEGRSATRLRNGFIIAEVAVTLTLAIAAILLTRQLIQQSRQDLGFSAENLITLDSHAVDPTPAPTPQQIASATPEQAQAFAANEAKRHLAQLDDTLNSLATVPGVESTAAILGAPMGFDGPDVGYAIKGRQTFAPGVENLPEADIRPVTPTLFSSMRIPLVRGRDLTREDTLAAPMVLVVNRELARQVFPGQDPIGQQIMCGLDEKTSWWTIVGVVGDIRTNSPGAPPVPTIYVPVAQHPGGATDMQLIVRTRGNADGMLETLRKRLNQTHPEFAIQATTMRQDIGETQRTDQFRSLLFGWFAAISILLATVGMYGVTAYSVSQRRFEFGLRIALGADRPQLLGMVFRQALTVAAIGIAAGIALSLSLTRVLSSVVGRLPAFDPAAYSLAVLAVLAIALLATLIPARMAAGVDPMTVLRSQ